MKVIRKLNRQMPTMIPGVMILLIIILPSALARFYLDVDLAGINSNALNLPPSPGHPLGTQSEGRDMLALILIGSWATLKIGIIGGGIGLFVGTMLGTVSGYFGGKVDNVINSIVGTGQTIPQLMLLILVASSFRVMSTESMGVVVALTAWMMPARATRSQLLSLRERNFVQMAKISMMNGFEIIFFEILPNLIPFLASTFVNAVSTAMLSSIGLEVLGLGSQQNQSLGTVIYYALNYAAMMRNMWWWWLPPVIVIVLIFVGLFLISISLDELGKPRKSGR